MLRSVTQEGPAAATVEAGEPGTGSATGKRMARTYEPGWSPEQAKEFVRLLLREVTGPGFALLSPRLRRALVVERAMAIVLMQQSEAVDVAAIRALVSEMLKVAGRVATVEE